MDNRIHYDTLHQQGQKNLVAKNCKEQKSEITAKLSDPKLLDAHLNSVNSTFKSEKEGTVTAVVEQARYHKVTENRAKLRFEYSAGSCPSNTVIKIPLDSGSDGDLMFDEKGTPMHFPT